MTEPSRPTYVYAVRMAIGVRTLARPCAVLAAFALLGCTAGSTSPDAAVHDAGHSACLPALARDCQPAFMPTYAKIYDNLLRTTCGAPSTGANCHGPDGGEGGLVLADMNDAYDYLLGKIGGKARVVPGKPECSLIIKRVESNDPGYVMPRGGKLTQGERCALRQWIADGALKQ